MFSTTKYIVSVVPQYFYVFLWSILHSSFLDKPSIISFKTDQKYGNYVDKTSTLTLTCKADGNPTPDYKLFHEGIKLSDNSDGVYTINSVSSSDDGQYKCVAWNEVGNITKSLNISIKGRFNGDLI